MLISALKYFVSEAAISLWRGRRSTVLSTLTIAAALFVLGVFLLLTHNLGQLVDRWSDTAELSVYLQDDVALPQRAQVQRALEGDKAVRQVEYVSKQAALERFRRDFPDLAPAASSEANPFPASLEARLSESAAGGEGLDVLAARVGRMPGVADVRYDRLWLGRLRALASFLGWAGGLLGVVLVLAAALTVSNVVRLALFSRRDEIEIMELVGAPLAFIRGPFIVEGILQGALGAVIALAALSAGFRFAQGRLAASAQGLLDIGSIVSLPLGTQALIVLGGMAVGCLGAVVASRRPA